MQTAKVRLLSFTFKLSIMRIKFTRGTITRDYPGSELYTLHLFDKAGKVVYKESMFAADAAKYLEKHKSITLQS